MAESLKKLSTLLAQTDITDHEEIIKTCNALLKKSKNDLETQHVKIVALLKCDRFEDAIRVIEEGGDALKGRASLEWSYALYKTGKLDEAIGAAAAAASAGRGKGAKHVEAQASYRAENFRQTRKIYDELCTQSHMSPEEEIDLRINMRATDAQLQWSRQAQIENAEDSSSESMEGFEIAYNVACGHLARGDIGPARVSLKLAKDLCQSSEDLLPEEKTAELLPITVQQLYVALQYGNLDEAASLAAEISIDGTPDVSAQSIAQNNILAASPRDSNPYLQHKLFHSSPKSKDADKLFSFQNRIFEENSHVLNLLVRKFDGVAKSTSKILLQNSSPTTSIGINALSILNIAAHCKNETRNKSLKKALALLEKRPNDVGLVLAIVQLYVGLSNVDSAISALESFFKRLEESGSESDLRVRFSPGLVSVLISLYKSQGRKRGIRAELSKSSQYWLDYANQAQSLLRVAGRSLLHSSNPSDLKKAGQIFSKLHELDTRDQIAAAGYLASYATIAPSQQIQLEANKLTPVRELVASIDIATLEQAGIPTLAQTTTATTSTSRKRAAATAAGGAEAPSRKKRIRKSRLPKDHDPNKQPDPERWLPLRDRSYYRPPKGKKGKQRAADRTQGGIVSEGAPEMSTSEAATAPQQKAAGGGASSSRKKKGKGKR